MNRIEARVVRRETHSPRSTAAVVVALLVLLAIAYVAVESVLQLLGLRPAPEFERWLERMGLMSDGRLTARAGDPSIFF